jgi:superfamily I DNA and/or RNA helicase
VVTALESLIAGPEGCADTLVLALYPAQAELIRRLVRQSPRLKGWANRLTVDVPTGARQREAPVVLVSLTRSHSHRAVSFGEGPQAVALALTRARQRLILFGDLGTLARRSQWEGPLDHLDEPAAAGERQLVTHLLRYLQGQGHHPQAFQLREGNGA